MHSYADAGAVHAITSALARLTSEKCHAARHGGEEFVVLFRGCTMQDAYARLDGLRESFARRHFVNRENDAVIGQITFSAGIADVFGYATARDALRATDMALYRAKEAGRNAVHFA